MKKLFFLIIFTLGMIPTIANAHTELTFSNPEAGQVVMDNLAELVLTFAGEIESLSTMKLTKDGQEIPLNVELQEKQMIGTLSTPLDDGSYVIDWSIAGEDGHLITGEIPFSVQVEQKVEQETETKEPDTSEIKDNKVEEEKQNDNSSVQNDKNSLIKIIIPVVVILILGIGLFLLYGRKR
ncbi:copper resistance CopC family protein [Neobacillus sp. FSL H8-0543]|uniref:copper resistance CopC family protein n=1 Tax=Neobacillus sp. FSL H8-0543 TaxID=2954672 RepID=UPI00315873B6